MVVCPPSAECTQIPSSSLKCSIVRRTCRAERTEHGAEAPADGRYRAGVRDHQDHTYWTRHLTWSSGSDTRFLHSDVCCDTSVVFLQCPGRPPILWRQWHPVPQVCIDSAARDATVEHKKALLLNGLGVEGLIFYLLAVEYEPIPAVDHESRVDAVQDAYSAMLHLLEGIFDEQVDLMCLRASFKTPRQQLGETAVQFILQTKWLARLCSFRASALPTAGALQNTHLTLRPPGFHDLLPESVHTSQQAGRRLNLQRPAHENYIHSAN
ncbi:hypothetical protein HPB51_023443 [Rhipicephalus microplus]|uniref:Uncharacterized protein n=1 Tax=Rhipicephalus microplus TaxID=6941 RepID=A0A9J6D7C4_RHIMP|nr:hypothetical protein HPB51_023443 [Rhipicephalus microplus]